jgi:hypothetical protein
MDCVAVGWLVWVTLFLVGVVVSRSLHGVVAVEWQLWNTV